MRAGHRSKTWRRVSASFVVVVCPLRSSELRSLAALMSSGCGPHGRNVVGAPSLLAGWVYGPGPAESGRHQCRAPHQDVPRDVRLLTADESQTRRTVDVVAPSALCGRLLTYPVQVLGGPHPVAGPQLVDVHRREPLQVDNRWRQALPNQVAVPPAGTLPADPCFRHPGCRPDHRPDVHRYFFLRESGHLLRQLVGSLFPRSRSPRSSRSTTSGGRRSPIRSRYHPLGRCLQTPAFATLAAARTTVLTSTGTSS